MVLNNRIEGVLIVMTIAAMLVIGFNMFEMKQLKAMQAATANAAANVPATGQNIQTNAAGKTALSQPEAVDVTPKGVPEIYGKELGVSYDDVSASNQQKADATIAKLGTLDSQIKLSGKDKERYIATVSQISCEYCCGTDSIIFKDGQPACGCQHSFAMRGLAKYLIKNHGNEYTNDAILEELGKWKTLFFPQQIGKKASVLKAKGIDINYINLASNKYRNMEN
ncbi:hypothetical protein HYS31_08675 [Candidatus Woesearchaeota archaeon]|nr:hypothetical protein [Candidatus Woesearchaeota archaeon]